MAESQDPPKHTDLVSRMISWLAKPSKQNLIAVRKTLVTGGLDLVEQFIDWDGVERIFEIVHASIESKGSTEVSLECLRCVKALMRTAPGLDYISSSDKTFLFLGKALKTPEALLKKQLLELMSALVVYSEEGYLASMNALEYHKNETGSSHGLAVIVEEIRRCEVRSYLLAALTFLNCLVISTDDLQQRLQIRRHLAALGLDSLLTALAQSHPEEDVAMQVGVYREQRAQDDAMAASDGSVDINDPHELFNLLLIKIEETRSEDISMKFLHILQNLTQVDPPKEVRGQVWGQVESHTLRASLVKSKEDLSQLQNSSSDSSSKSSRDKFWMKPKFREPGCTCSCHAMESNGIKEKVSADQANGIPEAPVFTLGERPSAPEPPPVGPPPPNIPEHLKPNIPPASCKMRSLNWSKIAKGAVAAAPDSLWWDVLQRSATLDIDYDAVQEHFRTKDANTTTPAPRDESDATEQQSAGQSAKTTSDQIRLLDDKRSLAVNVFIKQFKCSHEEILGKIRRAENAEMGMEKLRGLQKLLPNQEELEALRGYKGDKKKLGEAERFLKLVVTLPNYDLRIDAMMLREVYNEKVPSIESALISLRDAGREVMGNDLIRQLMATVLCVGNFVNQGGYAGSAVGIKLSSLAPTLDAKTNQYRRQVRHVIAEQLVKSNPGFKHELRQSLPSLAHASRESLESLSEEVRALSSKVDECKLKMAAASSFVRDQFQADLSRMESCCSDWRLAIGRLGTTEKELLRHFCESDEKMRLEHVYSILEDVVTKITSAIEDNETGRLEEERLKTREIRKSKSFNSSLILLQNAESASSDDFHAQLLETKSSLRASRSSTRNRNIRNSSSFLLTRNDSSDSSQDSLEDRVTPLSDIQRAKREHARKARERRKREMNILSQNYNQMYESLKESATRQLHMKKSRSSHASIDLKQGSTFVNGQSGSTFVNSKSAVEGGFLSFENPAAPPLVEHPTNQIEAQAQNTLQVPASPAPTQSPPHPDPSQSEESSREARRRRRLLLSQRINEKLDSLVSFPTKTSSQSSTPDHSIEAEKPVVQISVPSVEETSQQYHSRIDESQTAVNRTDESRNPPVKSDQASVFEENGSSSPQSEHNSGAEDPQFSSSSSSDDESSDAWSSEEDTVIENAQYQPRTEGTDTD